MVRLSERKILLVDDAEGNIDILLATLGDDFDVRVAAQLAERRRRFDGPIADAVEFSEKFGPTDFTHDDDLRSKDEKMDDTIYL